MKKLMAVVLIGASGMLDGPTPSAQVPLPQESTTHVISNQDLNLGLLRVHTRNVGHHNAARILLQFRRVRVAAIDHRLWTLQELHQPGSVPALIHIFEIWPRESSATDSVTTRAVLIEEAASVLLSVREVAEHENRQREGENANAVPTPHLPPASPFFLVNEHSEVHPRLPAGRSDFPDSEFSGVALCNRRKRCGNEKSQVRGLQIAPRGMRGTRVRTRARVSVS